MLVFLAGWLFFNFGRLVIDHLMISLAIIGAKFVGNKVTLCLFGNFYRINYSLFRSVAPPIKVLRYFHLLDIFFKIPNSRVLVDSFQVINLRK